MVLWLVACQSANPYEDKTIALVPLKTFPLPKISVRAMQLLSDKNVAFAGSDASFGFINTQNHTIALSDLKNKGVISDFRSVAATSDRFFMLSIGTPALLYKAEPSGITEVYRDDHPLAFYDSMYFLNDQFGIAVGDPIDSRMQVLVTHNGGKTWAKRTWCKPLATNCCGSIPKPKCAICTPMNTLKPLWRPCATKHGIPLNSNICTTTC